MEPTFNSKPSVSTVTSLERLLQDGTRPRAAVYLGGHDVYRTEAVKFLLDAGFSIVWQYQAREAEPQDGRGWCRTDAPVSFVEANWPLIEERSLCAYRKKNGGASPYEPHLTLAFRESQDSLKEVVQVNLGQKPKYLQTWASLTSNPSLVGETSLTC